MTVSILGSGNVATHIAKALKNADVKISQIWSRQFTNAQALADAVGAKAITEISKLDSDIDILLIAVKDDAIAEISSQLKKQQYLIAHTSGAIALNSPADHPNFGVFYPLQTFSKDRDIDFSNVPLCLEANNDINLNKLKKLAGSITNNSYEIVSEQRKTLHLAAVFACNFPNYLYGVAQQLLEKNELDFNIIKPLIAETANKVQIALPKNVQTGPAIRNDLQTLSAHEGLLAQYPEWLNIYKLLSQEIKNTR